MSKIFTSKANSLKILQKKIKNSKIEKIFDFTVKDWLEKEEKILKEISNTFKNSCVIVRSSALGEDSFESAQAGTYQSILNVESKNKKKIKNAINLVIRSYEQKGNYDEKNQILIQTQSQQIHISGVVFTKTPEHGSPYYVINFEEGEFTTTVTQGLSNQVVKIFRNISAKNLPEKWRLLIKSIREIESILRSSSLDIEFAITKKKKILIFQVRPITSITQNFNIKNLGTEITRLIAQNKKNFSDISKKKSLIGNLTFFSDMSDWNPSEIIGNNPNLLDYSTYEFLITNEIWHKSRTILGYHDANPFRLMEKFGNKPYINVRASFNSLLPGSLSRKTKKKLIKYYFDKLQKNPHLHDKVEFEILFTCYDFTIDRRLKELEHYGFTKDEINQIKSSLINITRDVLNNFSSISSKCNEHLTKLLVRRKLILSGLNNPSNSHKDLLLSAQKLLLDCKNYGTLSFSIMARISFIGAILLKSLQNIGIFGNNFYDNFINSVSTPLTEIQNDVSDFKNGKISKQTFFRKYGHLRPGTYDITQDRYDKNHKFFSDINFKKKKKEHNQSLNKKIVSKLVSKRLSVQSNVDLFDFIRDAITLREKFKFEFTKNLSDSLELIIRVGKEVGFSRNELANLDLNTILKSTKLSKIKLQAIWRKKIELQTKKKQFNNFLNLPQLLFSKNDFDVVNYRLSKPNFITDKKITEQIVTLRKNIVPKSIENKILLIERADPGFDWIFTKNPAGLITKYGGVASHMAIRCAEMALPAAIGCGEIIFSRLVSSSRIQLDCKNQQIFILEQKKEDQYTKEQMVLKSLGYIK